MRVVYNERMNAPAQGYSPSAAKPAAVMAAWRAQWPALEVQLPVPETPATIGLMVDFALMMFPDTSLG